MVCNQMNPKESEVRYMKDSMNLIQTIDLVEELIRRGATLIHTGPYQPYDITAKYGAAPIDGPAEVMVIQLPEPKNAV